jgi:Uma2 family endonuclease
MATSQTISRRPRQRARVRPQPQALPQSKPQALSQPKLRPQREPQLTEQDFARLSVGQYHAMAQAGVLLSGDPIELLEGYLVRKMTKHPPHVVATLKTAEVLREILPSGWHVRSQEPITTRTSEPEPDIAVVQGAFETYVKNHPRPDDVALVVEVSDVSLARDRGLKLELYARARITEYWIINLVDRQIEVLTEPSGPKRNPNYSRVVVYGLAESIPLVISGREIARIAVRDLLP